MTDGQKRMFPLIQFFLAIAAIYGALFLMEEVRLFAPLTCLVLMLVVGRVDRRKFEKATARRNYLNSEVDKALDRKSTVVRHEDFFTVDSLLWPKSEPLLIDAVHFIFRDLGFTISAGGKYHSVDRIVRIPGSQKAFGVQILMTEGELEEHHLKLNHALEFERERLENEKTLIIASTHIHLPLAERDRVHHMSRRLNDFLVSHHISVLPGDRLYEFWHKAKEGEVDIFGIFDRIYAHSGGLLVFRKTDSSRIAVRSAVTH